MPSHSSTSSFSQRLRGSAFPRVVLAILLVELVAHRSLVDRFASHEVDVLLRDIPRGGGDARVVLMGDSVGLQFFKDLMTGRDDVVVLASNQAVEMTGHFYALHRYLQHATTPPEAIVFLGKPPLGYNLEQVYTENYVQRCFTNWTEIAEIGVAKRSPVFAMKMVAYKSLATFRIRLHLQAALTGYTNAGVSTGKPVGVVAPASGADEHGLMHVIGDWITSRRAQDISDEYFERLIELSDRIDAPIYYIPAPLSEQHRDRVASASKRDRLAALARRTPQLHYVEDLQRIYPKESFTDGIHLTGDAFSLFRRDVRAFVEQLLSDAQAR